jgi:hypothetical protein
MSHHATTRAWESGATGNDLLVLLALADVAGGLEDPYDYAYPAVTSIASKTGISPRTVQRCLRSLEESGRIRKTGEHAWGRGKVTTQYRIEGVNATGRQIDAPVNDDAGGASLCHPTPSLNPVQKDRDRAGAREAKPDPRSLAPEGFPDELRVHAREVLRVLRAVAEQHNARKVWPLAVGRVVMAHPRHPLVATAHALAAWAVDPPREIRDVVSTYRRFLEQPSCRELETTERLAADGTPATGNGRPPAGVTPIRRPGQSSDWSTLKRLAKIDGASEADAIAYANSGGAVMYARGSTQPEGGPHV